MRCVALWVVLLGCNSVTPSSEERAKNAAAPETTPATTSAVQIDDSHSFVIESKITGQTYRIDAYVPASDVGKPMPVIYLTDGDFFFWIVAGVLQLRQFQGLEPVALVAIGYPGNLEQAFQLRKKDMQPSSPEPSPDGARNLEKFHRFMLDELRPAVANRFSVDHERTTLAGYSLGGLFALYALFYDPGAYRNYVAASPMANEWLAKFAEDFLSTSPVSPEAHLFLSAGTVGVESEIAAEIAVLIDRMAPIRSESFNITSARLDGEGHTSGPAAALARGIHEVLDDSKAR